MYCACREGRAQTFCIGGVREIKKIRRAAALILAVCLLLSASACGSNTDGNYRILKTFSELEFRIGYRNDDFIRYYIDGCVQTLAAEGVISNLALQWFGKDDTTFTKDAGALDALGALPYRSIIVGVDADVFPMSYINSAGSYDGFDVAVVRAVCERLGWDVRFQSIETKNAYAELSSGNIDVAWGGLALEADTSKYTVSEPYMTSSIVLVTRSGSGIGSVARLRHATLVIDADAMFMELLESDPKLMNKLDQITRVTGGMPACFNAMNDGSADATIAYGVAVRYYAKNY